MTALQFRADQAKNGRRKYGNKPCTIDNERFDSGREGMRWLALKAMLRSGEITDLERQVSIPLIGANGPLLTETGKTMRYVADFRYRDYQGHLIIEDAKGMKTKEYLVKKAVLGAMGVEIAEV